MKKVVSLLMAAVFGMSFLSGCGDGAAAVADFIASSSSFDDGAKIPIEFTGDGADKNPQIAWDNNPDKTKSFAVIVDDNDVVWAHWAVYNIASNVTHLDEGVVLPADTTQGVNSWGNDWYEGPNPPAGEIHTYTFAVYALSDKIDNADMDNKMTNADFKAKFSAIILDSASFTGKYR
jgi:Raf kinase inhibitor-like YbhB/YbcL family protein